MAAIVLSAILISAIIYLALGFSLSKGNRNLSDIFPVIFGGHARVETSDEFSKSTVATTVSLATIILAYFELAGYFGLWLLWTVITSAIGMWLVSLTAGRIWLRLSAYKHKPSMHEFIGLEFRSKAVAFIASLCTSLGFLLIFATELTVGSRFLAGLIPAIPQWISVVVLSSIGFIYTSVGGFRVVIKTDQLQMKFIWALIISLAAFYIYYLFSQGGARINLDKIPKGVLSLTNRPGLLFFLTGLTILNAPAYLSNMSIWQRISGADNREIITTGLKHSVSGLALSWTCLTLLACFGFMIVSPTGNQAYLTELLIAVSSSVFGKIVLFFVVLGLYGAMLSTSSTNLIVIGHTLSEDIIAKLHHRSLDERINSRKDYYNSRIILVAATIIAVFLVEGLKYFGFSIADLVFAIYGGALALFPLIMAILYMKKEVVVKLSAYAVAAVSLGFLSGWAAAIYGRLTGDSDLIFMAPGVSIFVSALTVGLGWLRKH